MTEPKYDEDIVNLGYLKKVISDTEENIEDTYKNVSRHYASKPNTPYYKGDTWIDGNIVYTCINSREIGLYIDSDWTTESGAKQEAERKNKTYLTQPSNYSAGDMWILQSDNDHKAGKKGEILISSAGRKEYNENDWTNMLGYGTIKSINEVSNNLNNAINRIGNVEEAIQDGIIITFYQSSIPEAKHVGDLWYVTGELEGYIKGKIYRYDGTNWVVLNDPAIQEAFDEANEARLVADGKIQSFYSDTEPTENMGVGDLWIDLANNNQLYRYNGTNWVAVYDTRINDLVTSVDSVTERVTTIETDLGEIDLKVQENTTTITTIEGNVNNITNTQAQSEGKNIHIEDSAEEPFVDISLHGESTQNGTPTPDNKVDIENIEGKNKFKNNYEAGYTTTNNGVTFTVNKDKSITANGTATDTVTFIFATNIKLKKGTYTVSGITSGSSSTYNITISGLTSIYNVARTHTINADTTYVNAFIRVNSGVTVDNVTFYPMIEEGTVATTYVPYNSLEFKVEGKNKFNVQDTNNVTEGITVDNEGWITVTGDNTDGTATKYFNYYTNNLNLKTGTNFNVIAEVKNVSGTGNASFVSVNSSSQQFKTNFYRNFSVLANNTIYNSINETSDEFLGNTGLRTFISFSAGQSGSITFRLSLLEDTTITPENFDYEPYKSQVVTFPLGEEKLMEGSYLADDGIHHTRKQYTFTGNETGWNYNSAQNAFWIRNREITNCKIQAHAKLCNYFPYTSENFGVAPVNTLCENSGATIPMFIFKVSTNVANSLETWKTWLQNHNLIVEYELAEPETVPYTAEQQEGLNNIKALTTYKNVTNITSTAYAKVTYMRDNGLDVYETKQNAEKNYTETTKKLAEQKITVDGIVSEVSETKSNISTMNNNLTELNETVASTKLKVDEYEIKFEEKTKTINEELKENSETIKSMSYTFNTDELSIAKSDDPVNLKINNSGMRVYSYAELKAIFNDKGSGIQKLIVVGSAQLGNLQIVKATDENGEECTDFHHLVSNIQELTDLEVG